MIAVIVGIVGVPPIVAVNHYKNQNKKKQKNWNPEKNWIHSFVAHSVCTGLVTAIDFNHMWQQQTISAKKG